MRRAACGPPPPRVEQHGRQAAGREGRRRGGGGNPTLDSWKLSELQTTFSHKVKTLEDVTHSQSWLTPTERKRRRRRGDWREKIRRCLKDKSFVCQRHKENNHLTCGKMRLKDKFTCFQVLKQKSGTPMYLKTGSACCNLSSCSYWSLRDLVQSKMLLP